MAKKFVLVLAAAVAVMAVLIALPNLNQQPPSDLGIEYSRQQVERTETGFVTQRTDLLSIKEDGSATYTPANGQEKSVTVTSEELRRIKALITETGFLRIPVTNYSQSDDAGEFTRYALRVRADDGQKTFNWVSVEASASVVPPIITNVGSHLDAIMDRP